MKISKKDWQNYIDRLRKINDKAADKVVGYMNTHDYSTPEGVKALTDYAHAVATKYGEGSAELACQMYDAIAEASRAAVPAAEPAATATYGEVAKAIYGTLGAGKDPQKVGSAIGRSVKLAGVDTLQKNALRDGAEWAWIPSGDTCAFCLMLASNGWQKASKKAIKNGHAEHVHTNCDCTYAVRFSDDVTVEGYDPDALYDEYISAGETSSERLNALRRKHYAANREYINAQKRAAYAKRSDSKLPDSEGMFETKTDSVPQAAQKAGASYRSAHYYPDNEGVFETIPRPRDDGKPNSIIKPRRIIKELNKSEVGKTALKYIEDHAIPVQLFYNVDVNKSEMGIYDPFSNTIVIYASNTKSARETALTVIHESVHARLGGSNTQREEALCFIEELKHVKRSDSLTYKEIKTIIKRVKKNKKYKRFKWR